MIRPCRSFCVKTAIFCAIFAVLMLSATYALSQDYRRYQKSGSLSSDDYLMKSFNNRHDQLFDANPKIIDLGLNLGIGSDCGRVDFQGTMKSTLRNLLDSKYFGDVGKDIVAASPMLLTCYLSPTWCAILKHTQVNANPLSKMRLDQCALVDKYTDSRTEDYYRERQDCVRQQIADNGGDLEAAMGQCQNNVYTADVKNWAGSSSGQKTSTNKLIESSTKWAGFTGDDADRTTDLLKALVGDTVLTKGNVSVEYGTRQKALTPERHLRELQSSVQQKLCLGIVVKVEQEAGRRTIDQVVTQADLKSLAPGMDEILVDRQTIESLAYMPAKQREAACKRLADTVALTMFTKDANRSMDVLTIATQNPNLPPDRKTELEGKRRVLKESIDLTLEWQRQRSEPLREVLSAINGQGQHYRDNYTDRLMRDDAGAIRARRTDRIFMDCSDGIMCGNEE